MTTLAAPAAWPAAATANPTQPKNKTSLLDVMADQFVQRENDQEDEEDAELQLAIKLSMQGGGADCTSIPEADPDLAIALRMQADLDLEHNIELAAREKQMNGNKKVSVSLENHRRPLAANAQDECDDEGAAGDNVDNYIFADEVVLVDERSLASHRRHQHQQRRGATAKDIVTKHDIPTNNRRNARRLEGLPINTGNVLDDPRMLNMGISNRVFNDIREYSRRNHVSSNMAVGSHSKSKRSMLVAGPAPFDVPTQEFVPDEPVALIQVE